MFAWIKSWFRRKKSAQVVKEDKRYVSHGDWIDAQREKIDRIIWPHKR
jgi:hypothetical protein